MKRGFAMFKNRSVILAAMISTVILSGCSVYLNTDTSSADETTVSHDPICLKEVTIPENEWQFDVTFPDWKGSISSEYAINNCVGFYGYSDQGKIYLECDEDAAGWFEKWSGRKKAALHKAEPLAVTVTSAGKIIIISKVVAGIIRRVDIN